MDVWGTMGSLLPGRKCQRATPRGPFGEPGLQRLALKDNLRSSVPHRVYVQKAVVATEGNP